MSRDDRLTRLRALVDELERLPASARRDWMLSETRARMADVETGDATGAMRPLAEDPPTRPAEQPAPSSAPRSHRAKSARETPRIAPDTSDHARAAPASP